MFTERSGKQSRLEMVILEDLVPQDHLLRKIDKAIDFSFINKICKPYYCENNGRPAIEPEVLFRMLFIGYLYGIRAEYEENSEPMLEKFLLPVRIFSLFYKKTKPIPFLR